MLRHGAQRPGDGRTRRRSAHAGELRARSISGWKRSVSKTLVTPCVMPAMRSRPMPRVDAAVGQRRQRAGLVHVVLNEDEVPVLEEAVAVAARLAVGVVAPHAGAEVVVELRAGPAGSGRPGGPQKLSPRSRRTMRSSENRATSTAPPPPRPRAPGSRRRTRSPRSCRGECRAGRTAPSDHWMASALK